MLLNSSNDIRDDQKHILTFIKKKNNVLFRKRFYAIKPFVANVLMLYRLKTPENLFLVFSEGIKWEHWPEMGYFLFQIYFTKILKKITDVILYSIYWRKQKENLFWYSQVSILILSFNLSSVILLFSGMLRFWSKHL